MFDRLGLVWSYGAKALSFTAQEVSILEAVERNDIHALEEMYKRGFKFEQDISNRVLEYIYDNDCTKVLPILIKIMGKDVNDFYKCWGGIFTALHLVCCKGDINAANALISVGANVNMLNSPKQTPLHLACMCGFFDLVKLLIGAGANINIQDRDGCTPLYYACQKTHLEIMEFLIGAGADWRKPYQQNPGHNTEHSANAKLKLI